MPETIRFVKISVDGTVVKKGIQDFPKGISEKYSLIS